MLHRFFFFVRNMSLNPQAEGKSTLDVLENGTLTAHYAQNDHAILINENIPGQYHIVQDGSTAPNCPIQKDQFTQVNISPNGTEVVDMDNSALPTTHPTANWAPTLGPGNNSHYRKIFVGFKNSMDALKEYDILVNSTETWKQTFVPYESYIVNLGRNDDVPVVFVNEPLVAMNLHVIAESVIVSKEFINGSDLLLTSPRSEERRVGKECVDVGWWGGWAGAW
jgi:hypothetical protein